MLGLSWLLRGLMALYFLGDCVFVAVLIGSAWLGKTSDVQDMLEFGGDLGEGVMPHSAGFAGAVLVAALYLFALFMIFWSVHLLFIRARTKTLASRAAGRVLRRLGQSMVALFFLLMAGEIVLPVMLYAGKGTELFVEYNPLSAELILLFVGAAIWLLSHLAEEAEQMREELSHVV